MKKLIAALFFIPSMCYGIFTIEKPLRNVVTEQISVSTESATALYVGSANLTARTKLILQNIHQTYDISIGTSSAQAYADGFILTNSSDAATSRIEIPVSQGTILYGIGEANSADGTIELSIIEIRQ